MNKKIRVAFIGETTYPSNNIKWINTLVENFDVQAIVITRPNQNVSHLNDGILIYKILRPFPFFNPFALIRYVRKVNEILKKNEIDIVHFLWGVNDPALGVFISHPYFITTHGSDILRDLKNHYLQPIFRLRKRNIADLIKRQFHLKAYRKASFITSASYGQMALLEQFQPKIKKHEVIRSAINPSLLNVKRNDSIVISERVTIFSPRTMRPIYNQDIIIEAFNILLSKYPHASLRMIDNMAGSEWSLNVRKLIKDLNLLDKVVLLPSLSPESMNEEYYNADITVMIPKSDGVPVSGMESMIIGTPLIIGANDYDTDVFSSEWVWKLAENSPKCLLDTINEVINEDLEKIKMKVKSAQKIGKAKGDMRSEMAKVAKQYKNVLAYEMAK